MPKPRQSKTEASPLLKRLHKKLSTPKKLLYSLIVTCGFLVASEFTLYICGVQSSDALNRRDSLTRKPLFEVTNDHARTLRQRLTYFNDQQFSVKKQPDELRIFCLGGSTTFGRPFRDGTSYVGWLRAMLKESGDFPASVVNCGGISYASYRLAGIAQEVAKYTPDVIIVHTGHNEFLEERTFRTGSPDVASEDSLFKLSSRSRLVSMIQRWFEAPRNPKRGSRPQFPEEVEAILDRTAGPTSYKRDDRLHTRVCDQFRTSLQKIIATGKAVDADVFLITPACNLRDFQPFKSEIDEDCKDPKAFISALSTGREAIDKGLFMEAEPPLRQAVGLSPRHAEANFLLAKSLYATNRFSAARRHFSLAKDEDVCPLRATQGIEKIVDDFEAEGNVHIVRFRTLVNSRAEQSTGEIIPGRESFLDHVHPNIETHSEIAILLYQALVERGHVNDADAIALRDRVKTEITDSIDQRGHALALSNLSQVLAWAGNNDEASRLAVLAYETCDSDPEVICQYARMQTKNGRPDDAIDSYLEALSYNDKHPLALARIGGLLLIHDKEERRAEARDYLERAYRTTPTSAPKGHVLRLLVDLGDARIAEGDAHLALQAYHQALQIDPAYETARTRIGIVHQQRRR